MRARNQNTAEEGSKARRSLGVLLFAADEDDWDGLGLGKAYGEGIQRRC